MEERWFQVDNKPPVEEGELTWRVAKILALKLRALGAEVSFRPASGIRPTTALRPDGFREIAREVLAKIGLDEPRQGSGRRCGQGQIDSVAKRTAVLSAKRNSLPREEGEHEIAA